MEKNNTEYKEINIQGFLQRLWVEERQPRQNLPLRIELQSRAMPQRALFKIKPWVFVSADDMSMYEQISMYEQLPEQQLREEIPMEDPSDILNDAALGTYPRSNSTVVSPTKREREEPPEVESSPNKRMRESEDQETPDQATVTPPNTGPKKLGRPKKVRRRHMISTYPAVRRTKGDIWDPDSGPEKPSSKPAAHRQPQRPKKAMAPKAGDASTNKPSSPIGQVKGASTRSPRRSTRASTKAEGQRSALLNGKVDLIKKPERDAQKAKKQKKTTRLGPPTSHPKVKARSTKPRSAPTSNSISPEARKAKGVSSEKPSQNQPSDDERQDGDDDFEEVESNEGEAQQDPKGQQSNHDGHMQLGSDDEAASEAMDLLGQEREWKKVLESARSVHKIKLATATIRELLLDIKEAKSIYKKLINLEEIARDEIDALNEQLRDSLDAVEQHIERISERQEPSKRPEMVRDIYARAIPQTVFLLECALILRTSQPRGLRVYSALAEVVRLQTIIVKLCMKAKSWSIKPNTSQPIVKQTTSVILPYVRDTRDKFFSKELKALYRQEKIKQNALWTQQREKDNIEQSQRDAATFSQQCSQTDPNRILNHIREEQQRLRNLRKPVASLINGVRTLNVQPVPPVQKRNTGITHEWTEEEVIELIVQLGKKESRHLRGKQL